MSCANCANCGRPLEPREDAPRCALCGYRTLPDAEPFAKRLLAYPGKRIVIGLTFVDANLKPLRHQQLSGVIAHVSTEGGVLVKLDDSDEVYKLPPALDQLKPAPKGEYRLRTTGKVVVDPDLMTAWTITQNH